jgi:outer membrane lipoprotein carrier protein
MGVTRKILLLPVTLCFLVGAMPAAAQVRNDDVGEVLVNRFINDVITLQGRFEQSLLDAEGTVVERSSGTLEIERPGRFRWSYSEPYEQWLVADGLNIWSYDVDLAQVTVKPQADALANTPALLLGGGDEALEQFRFERSVEEQGTTWVRMIPLDTSSGFERMELGFTGDQLTRMVFFDNLEQTTLVALYDVQTNEPIAAGRFEFVIPDDADLVGVPVVAEDSTP